MDREKWTEREITDVSEMKDVKNKKILRRAVINMSKRRALQNKKLKKILFLVSAFIFPPLFLFILQVMNLKCSQCI